MILPRLIIADEVQEGRVPPSLILIQAIRNRQIPVNIFFCGRSEEDIRIMKLISNAPLCCLDTYTMGSPRNLKTLFERRSSENALSVVSVPLGMKIDERTFQTSPMAAELARILDCSIIPIVAASAQAVVSATLAFMAFSDLNASAPGRTSSLLFSSMKNPREFQILEREFSRRTPAYVLGYMPESAECNMPSLQAMSDNNKAVNMSIISIKSAALQLSSQIRQVDWKVLDALSCLDTDWGTPVPFAYPKKTYNVAVVGHPVSLEGDGNLEVFRMMGCKLYTYNHKQDKFPINADVIYFPHTLTTPYLAELLVNTTFRQGMIASIKANKRILAMGSSALLFGAAYRTSDHCKIDGLRVFPYGGTVFSEKDFARDQGQDIQRIEARSLWTTCFAATDEKIRGSIASGFSIANPGNLAPSCLSYREMHGETEMGLSGWTVGNCFVTDLKLDLWSALDAVNHWLTLTPKDVPSGTSAASAIATTETTKGSVRAN